MERRRLGGVGHESTVLIYGAAALAEVDQDTADASLQEALDAGINHFDVAADYGDAELRLAPWLREVRSEVFLATKTVERERDAAWAQINDSLERLGTDRVDLLQLHSVGDLETLDQVTGRGGALEAAVRAQDEGLVGAVGITGHTHTAPRTHLEALRRHSFATVLTPINLVLSQRTDYRDDYDALVSEAQTQGVGLMATRPSPGATGPRTPSRISRRGTNRTWIPSESGRPSRGHSPGPSSPGSQPPETSACSGMWSPPNETG